MADDEKKDSYGDFQDGTKAAYLKHLRDPESDKTNDKYNEDVVYYEVDFETAKKMKVEGTATKCTTSAITPTAIQISIKLPPGSSGQKIPIPSTEQTTCTIVVPDVFCTHRHYLMTKNSCRCRVSIC